jgi:TPR repeat protein
MQDTPSNAYSKKNMCLKLHMDIEDISSVSTDLIKLKQLVKHAVIGDGQAMFTIGKKYYDGEDFTKNKDIGFRWMLKGAKAGSKEAILTVAKIYKQEDCIEQNYLNASIWYSRGARLHDNKSQFELGSMYYQGLGVRKDALEASRWYTFSASNNKNSDAQCQLGILRAHGEGLREDIPEAISWFTASAKQRNQEAIYRLAKMFEAGTGVPLDFAQALKFYKIAADLGHLASLLKLADEYGSEGNTYYDIEASFRYCEQAANQDDPQSIYKLAIMYLGGKGVSQDYIQAYYLFKKSKDLGYTASINLFSAPMDYGNSYYIDYEKIAIMFELVCRNGIDALEYNLGYYFEHEASYDYLFSTFKKLPNFFLAKRWYKKADEKGVSDAQYRLGVMYEEGKGLSRSRHKTIEYYTKASHNGNMDATYRLGCFYLKGYNSAGDFRKAFALFTQAASMGHKQAVEALNSPENLIPGEKIKKMLEEGARSGSVVYQYRLGVLRITNGTSQHALHEGTRWLSLASQKGFTDAFYELGGLFEQGKGVIRDYHESIRLYQIAAEKGNENALCKLAQIYHLGKGVPCDYIRAYYYYTCAADQGSQLAQAAISVKVKSVWKSSVSHLENQVMEYEKYFEMWEYVAERGNPGLQYSIGSICEEIGSDPKTSHSSKWYLQAFGWYFKATRQAHVLAIYRLGRLYEMGWGVNQDYIEAALCYERAGMDKALYYLGAMHHLGHGVEPNLQKALGYYKEAAEKGSSQAHFILGKLYQDDGDLVKAVKRYVISASQGNQEAQARLDHLVEEITGDDLFYVDWFNLLSHLADQEEYSSRYQEESFLGSVHYNLGHMFYYGQGTKIDYKEAWKHFKRATTIYKDSRAIEFSTLKYGNVDTSEKQGFLKKLEMVESVQDQLIHEEQYELGLIYLYGVYEVSDGSQSNLLVQHDHFKSIHYFKLVTEGEASNEVYPDDDGFKDKTKWEATRRYFSSSYYLGIIHCVDIPHKNDKTPAIYYLKHALDSNGDHDDTQFILESIEGDPAGTESIYVKMFEWHKTNEDSHNPVVNYNLGWMYSNGIGTQINYKNAFYYFKIAAGFNHTDALYELGSCYDFGHGVDQDTKTAIEWYLRAARLHHTYANYNIANIYKNDENPQHDYKKAQQYYEVAALYGDQRSQYELGGLYKEGLGVEKDHKMAIYWYEKAAIQGHVRANYWLGYFYSGGMGVEKDYNKSMEYSLFAANSDDKDGQFQVGYQYYEGYGVEKDYKKALYWYGKAAEQKEIVSNHNLGMMYAQGEGDKINYSKAFQYYSVAAEQDYKSSQFQLGFLYYHGLGVKKDVKQAEEWFIKAANQNVIQANLFLGYMYSKDSKDADNDAAIKHFKIAANQGNEYCQFALGRIYLYGYGVEKDIKTAMEWLTKGSDQNYAVSSFLLAIIYIDEDNIEHDWKMAMKYLKLSVDQGFGDIGYKLKQFLPQMYVFKDAYRKTVKFISKALELKKIK